MEKQLFHIIAVAFYLFACVWTLACSTIFHTCYCHSQTALYRFTILDYSGISMLVIGAQWPMVYFTFADHAQHLSIIYYL